MQKLNKTQTTLVARCLTSKTYQAFITNKREYKQAQNLFDMGLVRFIWPDKKDLTDVLPNIALTQIGHSYKLIAHTLKESPKRFLVEEASINFNTYNTTYHDTQYPAVLLKRFNALEISTR